MTSEKKAIKPEKTHWSLSFLSKYTPLRRPKLRKNRRTILKQVRKMPSSQKKLTGEASDKVHL
jgi:hypothetical protein